MNERLNAVGVVAAYNDTVSEIDDPGFLEKVARFLADDALCYEATGLPWGGQWQGPEGIFRLFATIEQALMAAPRVDLDRVVVSDAQLSKAEYGQGIVFREYTLSIGTNDGDSSAFPCIERYVVRDDKIAAITVYFFDCAALSALLDAQHGIATEARSSSVDRAASASPGDLTSPKVST